MARRLTLELNLAETLLLQDVAQKRAVLATDDRRVLWEAIAREAARAITLDEARRQRL